jgi:hypothetical protein
LASLPSFLEDTILEDLDRKPPVIKKKTKIDGYQSKNKRPSNTSQGIIDEVKFFKDLISSNTGKIIDEEDWGLRELSYNILKFKKYI